MFTNVANYGAPACWIWSTKRWGNFRFKDDMKNLLVGFRETLQILKEGTTQPINWDEEWMDDFGINQLGIPN